MVTKRTPVARSINARITAEMIDLYRKAVDLQSRPEPHGIEHWEESGGVRRQYIDTCRKLHVALGRKPWETMATDTIGEDEPDPTISNQGEHKVADWMEARELGLELQQAAFPDG